MKFSENAYRMKSSLLWDIMPCSPLKANQRFGGTRCLHLQSRRISQARNQREAGSKHSLKMEAACSSETLVDFQWTTWRYIPEDRTLHNYAVRTSNHTCIRNVSIIRQVLNKPMRYTTFPGVHVGP
jgi:hypothetical protein